MRYAKIGGQAVIEGIMMRYGKDYAVAVRREDGSITVKKDEHVSLAAKCHMTQIPIIRGILAFVDSLVLGMSTLTYSASFFEDEDGQVSEEPDNSPMQKFIMGVTVCVSIIIAVALFMVAPFLISNLFGKTITSAPLLSLLEGVIRLAVFFVYILAISQMKDIQRVFMYHGAEHKTINCIEHGEELTPQNAAKYSRQHKRCGTSFLLIVMVISVIFFVFIRVDGFVPRLVSRLVLIPVVAGVSYEVIQWAGRSESKFVALISKPGMMLQNLTTREPDESMLEVAIAAIEAIYDWRAFQQEVRADREKTEDGR